MLRADRSGGRDLGLVLEGLAGISVHKLLEGSTRFALAKPSSPLSSPVRDTGGTMVIILGE